MVVFAGEINESDKVFMVNDDKLYTSDSDANVWCPRRSSSK